MKEEGRRMRKEGRRNLPLIKISHQGAIETLATFKINIRSRNIYSIVRRDTALPCPGNKSERN
ncbi:MAG: hypothetical protein HC786_08970 [Richelia sp. CSU_2_1]|nr:hypothetical protein [Richelia sp. CSU_2_1]